MNRMNPLVDPFFAQLKKWKPELHLLRQLVLTKPLTEELKWHAPCYSVDGGNVLIMGELNDSCVLSFFKGVLLADPHQILTAPGENTRSGRVIRFTSTDEITRLEQPILQYIDAAIQNERDGRKVDFAVDRDIDFPEELLQKFAEDPAFQAAFEALTPGRQRGYLLQFTAPKQSKTRTARIEKWLPKIMRGMGMHDY